MKKEKIGAIQGHIIASELFKGMNLVLNSNYHALFQMMQKSIVDVVFADTISGETLVKVKKSI